MLDMPSVIMSLVPTRPLRLLPTPHHERADIPSASPSGHYSLQNQTIHGSSRSVPTGPSVKRK